ncbi:MAG: TolC family protein [Prevotellaceae bacterium]|jgi:outer membrane protein TolC|nr:TolC family protein [Prevotellaceae bacterium]
MDLSHNAFFWLAMNFKLSFLLLFSFFAAAASAQDTALYSLPMTLEMLLENGYAIKFSRNREEALSNNATYGNAGMLPKVNATAGYSGAANQLQNVGEARYANTFNNGYNLGLSGTWTLFDGWGMQASYSRLQEMKKNGELSTRLEIESSVAQTIAMYYELLHRRFRLENLSIMLSLSRERLRMATEKYLVGAHSQLELLQAQVDFNADSSQLVTYRQGTIEQLIRFKKQLLLPFDTNDVIFTDTSFNLNEHLKLEELKAVILQNNTSLKIFDKNRTITDLERAQVEAARYPYVNLNASYGYTYNQTGYNNSSSGALGLSYGVSVGVKIYDGKNQRRLEKNIRIEQRNRELEYEQQAQQVLADLYLLYSSYSSYMNLLGLERINRELAGRKVLLAMEQYRLGQITSLELREHQRTHLDAQDRLLNAMLQAKLSEVYIMQLCGAVLNYMDAEELLP